MAGSMRHETINRIQRTLMLISFLAVLGIALIGARVMGIGLPGLDGLSPQGVERSAFDKEIGLVSGHAGFDSGAICTDASGSVTLTEAEINAKIADIVAKRLRRAGADVTVFEEYDPRLAGLRVDVLLSLHADSCIDATGFKAANSINSAIPTEEQRLLDCLETNYAMATALQLHPNTVTHAMTEYHVFNRIAPQTPAAILEMGFLGGDQNLLANRPQVAAKGIADSLLCFLDGEDDGMVEGALKDTDLEN
jgi:N-acetylmuramoyl-L-alanine amidase